MTRAEARTEAKRLVIQEGQTYLEASAAVGVPLSTIQKWAAAEEWQSERDAGASYSATIKALKRKLLDNALTAAETGTDPSQLVYAWKVAEAAYPEHRYASGNADPKARLAIAADVLDALVADLADIDRNVLTVLSPHLPELGKRLEARYAA